MDIHRNARTLPHSRMLIVRRLAAGWSVSAVATATGVTAKTVRKWRDRYATEGARGLVDRSSRPHRSPARLDLPARTRSKRCGVNACPARPSLAGSAAPYPLSARCCAAAASAACPPLTPAARDPLRTPTAGRVGPHRHQEARPHRRHRPPHHRRSHRPKQPAKATGQSNRRAAGRGLGWEYLHVAIEDRSRLAFTQLLPSERKEDATAFLESSFAWFKQHGITVQRVMTDNGSAYKSKLFAAALDRHDVAHERTRPYTPKTNGKAERFIQSSIREWAYASPFNTSAERKDAMHPWLHHYNTKRPHSALAGKPPVTRLNRNNVLGSDT